MPAFAKLEYVEERNRRGALRRTLNLDATLATTGDEVLIHDLSSTGLLIQTQAELSAFERFEVVLPERGATEATVIWNSGRYYGCQFTSPMPKSALSAALLRNPAAVPTPTPPGPSSSAELADDGEADDEPHEFSLAVRLRVLIGLTILSWAIILWTIRAVLDLL